MDEVKYGANGVRLTDLNDYQLKRESSGTDLRACISCVVGVGLAYGALIYVTTDFPPGPERTVLQIGGVASAVISIAAALVTFGQAAQDDLALPRESESPTPAHITGLGAALILALGRFA